MGYRLKIGLSLLLLVGSGLFLGLAHSASPKQDISEFRVQIQAAKRQLTEAPTPHTITIGDGGGHIDFQLKESTQLQQTSNTALSKDPLPHPFRLKFIRGVPNEVEVAYEQSRSNIPQTQAAINTHIQTSVSVLEALQPLYEYQPQTFLPPLADNNRQAQGLRNETVAGLEKIVVKLNDIEYTSPELTQIANQLASLLSNVSDTSLDTGKLIEQFSITQNDIKSLHEQLYLSSQQTVLNVLGELNQQLAEVESEL